MNNCRRSRIISACLISILCLSRALLAVSGIAVTNKCSSGSTRGDGTGSIWKFVVSDDVSDYPGTQIYSGTDASCVRINQSGTKVAFHRGGKICMIDINGGPVTELATAAGEVWVDFPEDEWIYFLYYGTWHRVSTDGNATVERDVLSTVGGTTHSIARGGNRGACNSWNRCGSNGATVYGDMSFCRSGCGAGISISGRYLTHNESTHQDLNVYDLNNGGAKVGDFHIHNFGHVATENWNVNGFSANSDDWLCFKQGEGYTQGTSSRQVLYMKDGSHPVEIQPLVRGVFYEGGDFWVGDVGPIPPTINLSAATLSFTAEAGSANPSSRNVTVSNAGDEPLGTITVSDDAAWLSAELSGSTITNAVDITDLNGSYTATVTVNAANASSSKSYTVNLTVVAPPRLSTITIRDKTVEPGATTTFVAVGHDQFGDLFALPAVSWTVSGGGSIGSDGVFTAGSIEGTFTVTATAGDVSGTANAVVAVAPAVHIKVNAGGDPVEDWVADGDYTTTGGTHSFGGTHDVSGVTDPAPNEVYQTVRNGNHTYSFDDLPDGTYTVRLHFTDAYGGDRAMDYTIEGVKVIDDLDIVEEAGATSTALIKEFSVTVSDGDGLQIVADKDLGNDVFESGIEVIGGGSEPAGPLTLLSHNGGQLLTVGDSLRIEWECNPSIVNGVKIEISPDEGENFYILSTGGSLTPVMPGETTRGAWEDTVPATAGGQSIISGACLLRVSEYSTGESIFDVSDNVFTIQAGSVVTESHSRLNLLPQPAVQQSGGVVLRAGASPMTAEVYSVGGRRITRTMVPATSSVHVALPPGVYVVNLHNGGGTLTRMLRVLPR